VRGRESRSCGQDHDPIGRPAAGKWDKLSRANDVSSAHPVQRSHHGRWDVRAAIGKRVPVWLRRLAPDSNEGVGLEVLIRVASHVSVMRTLYLSARYRGWLIVSRGTRLKVGPRSSISISRGSYLFLGFAHFTPTPCSVHLGRDARLSIEGTVQIHRGTRVFVSDGGHLEIGTRSYINDCSTVTCCEHIKIGSGCSISWNTNILDANMHELVVKGIPRPRSGQIIIGDDVWIGTGATILAGVTIGNGAVVAAGSVVTSAVPSGSAVAGTPARIVHERVSWQH
jgi:tetrahydrodipicolinate N-acetyltransferase